MAHLTYYRKEDEEFAEEFKKELPNTEATVIVTNKLLKHYKLGKIQLGFTSGRNHSCAGRWSITINTEQNNFGVICHELSHVYQARKEGFERGDHWHTKVHRKIMKRMLNYCRKKKWFEDELNRRLAPKESKPEPTKDELRQKKIIRLQQNIKRNQTRIKRFQTLIKTANRRISALNRFLEA